jgi:hydroxymethylpyrimidine kinase/phosphomethylpyrimidine kinase
MKETSIYESGPVCLAIGGLDPSGGAGILVDVRTFAAHDCTQTAAVTSVTFQNKAGVFGAVHQSGDTIRKQIEAVLGEYDVQAVKTGMLPTTEIVESVCSVIIEYGLKNVVVDPVIRSTSGFELIDAGALETMADTLFPIATLITPNIPEAELISQTKILTVEDIEKAALRMQSKGARNVLIKGGHFAEAANAGGDTERQARDFLFEGGKLTVFEADFVESAEVRGTGCMLASAIAAHLALGKGLRESVNASKAYVGDMIRKAVKG